MSDCLYELFHELRDLDGEDIYFSNEAVISPIVPNKFMNRSLSYDRVRRFFFDWYTNYDGQNIKYKLEHLSDNEIRSYITDFLNIKVCFH